MTVRELKEKLDQFPDDMNVQIACDFLIRAIDDVDEIVDMDTNVTSVYIHDKYDLRATLYENGI